MASSAPRPMIDVPSATHAARTQCASPPHLNASRRSRAARARRSSFWRRSRTGGGPRRPSTPPSRAPTPGTASLLRLSPWRGGRRSAVVQGAVRPLRASTVHRHMGRQAAAGVRWAWARPIGAHRRCHSRRQGPQSRVSCHRRTAHLSPSARFRPPRPRARVSLGCCSRDLRESGCDDKRLWMPSGRACQSRVRAAGCPSAGPCLQTAMSAHPYGSSRAPPLHLPGPCQPSVSLGCSSPQCRRRASWSASWLEHLLA